MRATRVRPAAPLLVLVLLHAAVAAASCRRAALHFSTDNARAHVGMLAGTIGMRPTGTEANRRAREYVIEQLRLYGFAVRVQEVDARRAELGLTARVANVIAVLPGRAPEALGLVSHYDSEWTTPGAGDSALGTAVALETARLIAARPARAHSLMVLLTDGEEMGLMGAAGLLEDPEVKARLRAYINLEAVGNGPPAVLFQSGPGNRWIVQAWAAAAPEPRGASYHFEIYRRLPNDTDFTVLSALGAPGLNIAAVGGSFAYHTSRDTPERLDPDVVAQMGRNVLATALALDARDLTVRTREAAVFSDVAGTRAWAVGPLVSRVFSILALITGAWALGRAFGAARRAVGLFGIARTIVWVAVGVVAVAAAMVGAASLLRAVREVYHPWYAHPNRFAAMLVLAGFSALWLLVRLAARLPPGAQAAPHPAVIWAFTLTAWIALTGASEWFAPSAAYLWSLPLAAASLAVLLVRLERPGAAPLGGALVLAVSAGLWLPEVHAFVQFVNPMLGRLPVVAPASAMPALLLAGSSMVVPPLAVVFVSTAGSRAGDSRLLWTWRRLRTPALAAGLSIAFAACYLAEAYTPERPLWRAAQFAEDLTGPCAAASVLPPGCAAWEVGGIEPGLDLALGRGAPTGWATATGPTLALAPVSRLPHPFTFRAPARSQPPPGRAESRVASVDASGAVVEVTALPAEAALTAAFILPAGLTPRDPSLPGRLRNGRWTAVFQNVPMAGITWRGTVPATPGGPRPEVTVAFVRAGLPGGEGLYRLPPWLGTARTSWEARSTWYVPASPAGDSHAPLR